MNVPAGWLREYVAFEWPLEEVARRLVFTSCEVDRILRRGVPASHSSGSTRIPVWSVPSSSSRSERIIPFETSPRSFARSSF